MESFMGKEEYDASTFALNLRLNIWNELFGFDKKDLADPIDEELWIKVRERAKVLLLIEILLKNIQKGRILLRKTAKFIGKFLLATLIIQLKNLMN